MKVTFDPGGGPVTLADVGATPRLAGVIEQLGGESVLQPEKVYGQASEVDYPRGNVGGFFIFRAMCSYADYDTAAGAWKTAYGRLNGQGPVVFTPMQTSVTTLTMANAILHNVQRTYWQGKGLEIRYTFKITTIT